MQISSSRDQFNSLAERYSQSPVHRAGPSLPVLLDLAAPAKFLDEAHRVLTNNGRFILADQISPAAEISDWIDYWERTRDPSHFLQRTVSQWQDLARDAGFSWIKHQIVPYRLQFDWWVTQAGYNAARIAELNQHFGARSPEVTRWLDPKFDGEGQLISFVEPMLVARMEP